MRVEIKKLRQVYILALTLCLSAVFTAPTVAGASGALSQAFATADGSLTAGTLVDLKSGTANAVEKATSAHVPQLLGVVANKPLIALGDGKKQTQVVVSGSTLTLVSNINGAIKVGDKITASPIQGVGMKATTSTEIVGTAESTLTTGGGSVTQRITDNSGKAQTVRVGLVTVQINVSYYQAGNNALDNFVPSFLLSVGSSIAGKAISPLRALIGFCSLLVGFIIAGLMLQAGVRSGVISLGRNPLASKILRRSLLDVLLTALGLLAITVVTFYIILTV